MKQTFKKLSAFMMALAISGTLFAQVPQKFNYQGIARDTKGNPMAQQRMTLKLTVLPTADATTGEYEEIQTVTTNEFGLYTLQIGNGTPVTGEMKAVKWETGNKYIKVAIDPKGGNDFVDAGTNQLLSVPYAIYADKAGMAKTAGGDRTGAVNSAAGHVAGDANYLTKFTGLNVIGKSLVFDNGVGVGIGTNAPIAGSTMHLKRTTNGNHLYMENPTATAFGAFRMINDVPANFFTFSKYGSTYPGGYTGIATLYPFANILGMGNNGPFLNASTGNMGMAITKAGTNKLKFHIHASTERIGIGGSSVPAAQVHFNNTDAGNDTIKFTNNTTGHLVTDGTEIRTSGNNTRIINRENGYTILGTNNTDRLAIDGTGNVGIGTTTPSTRLDVNGQVRIQGGAPGAGKVLTSDATGLATWTTPSITSVGGTTNYIPKYTPNGTTLGNSRLLETVDGLIYNSTSLSGNYNHFHYRLPVGSSAFYNIQQNNAQQNYISLTQKDGNSQFNGIVMGDSTDVNSGFSNHDSVAFIGRDYTNKLMFGNASLLGLGIQLESGKINTSYYTNNNAHFTINSPYDTAAHFSSINSNSTNNYGIISEVSSNRGGTGLVNNITYTGSSNPSYSKGVQTYIDAGTQDAIGEDIYITNPISGNGYTGGISINTAQFGGGSNWGINAYASTYSTTAGNYTRGGTFNAYAPDSNLGSVTGLEAYASGGNSQVVGVRGQATGRYISGFGTTDAYGIYGQALGGTGQSDYAYSVYGAAATGALVNYAGYFNGNTHVNGALSKSSGTFKIDHPQDPENKYLIHSFVESPDMMNVYNGNITTDANGIATVSLPTYFQAENKDFKYQLTVIDNSNDFVMAKVTEEVNNNSFKVKTSKPNVKISWQVTGVRQDAWANAHRVVPEVEKGEREKGKYLNPEVFGKDKSLAMHPEVAPTPRLELSSKEKEDQLKNKKVLEELKNKKMPVPTVHENAKGASSVLAPSK